ncbi:DgyrCDS14557 [Dimorphilus gyrociliatus]|uniref:DgyrCDS14557 n=1 Tax=Dimorphilus gyrociliatus TaxID=2664684 RepID=A0A7I8WE71_9ANNE|nr:DgyrCDS14557 [Dimorphilus gyrociliatus]
MKMKCLLCKHQFHIKCIEGLEIKSTEVIIKLKKCSFKKTQKHELSESAKGKNILIHKGGWYALKCIHGKTTYWTCGVRTKKQKCKAGITEFNFCYTLSKVEHFHSPVKDIENKLLLKKNVR